MSDEQTTPPTPPTPDAVSAALSHLEDCIAQGKGVPFAFTKLRAQVSALAAQYASQSEELVLTWKEVYELRAKTPDDVWMERATAERVKRVAVEAQLAAVQPLSEWRILNVRGEAVADATHPDEHTLPWWDRSRPKDAPHRLVQLAEIDAARTGARTIAGLPLVVDPAMPPDAIELRAPCPHNHTRSDHYASFAKGQAPVFTCAKCGEAVP